MDEDTKELIAIGASVSAHCQPCLSYHVGKAQDMGIAEEEIREAIAVGHLVERGSMQAMKSFAAGVFKTPAGPVPNCCSGENLDGVSCWPERRKGR